MGDRSVRCACAALAFALAGCGQIPLTVGSGHLKPEAPRPQGAIPAPVQVAPVLPVPKPTARPETYSVVVNEVRVHDLLFALARDAKLNVDIHPGVTGTVTLNALDQTLPQLLNRISRQVDMRYEIDGPNLIVMRDTPYLRVYRIDYVNLARDSKSVSNLSTQVSGTTGSGGGSSSQNNSTAVINSISTHKFWETLTMNIKELLRETDRLLPAPSAQAPAPAPAPAATTPPPPGGPSIIFTPAPAPTPPLPTGPEFREAAAVIVNPEAGVISIRATSRQHEKIQEFLDQVMASAKRQVLIEVTVMEVQLNNQYQRGIDWSRVRSGASGFTLSQSSVGTPAGISTTSFIINAAAASIGFSATIKLLESFGDVRVLSSPKVSVLNNQTAVLKVVDNLVYFTIQANTTVAGTGPAVTTFSTTVNSVPVGFIMSVVPQISENDSILLNLRPTISRKIGDVADPNPSLGAVASFIPVIQTREMESIMRVQSGQVAVLGGLMQDSVTNIEDTIPGVRSIPGLGTLLAQRKDLNQKTELVIFLQPTVIRDASLEGDLRHLRNLLPGEDYFTRPNPSR